MSFMEAYRLELELLGPVHVGTGEAFPAYSYLVDEARKEVLILDSGRLLELLSEKQRDNYLQAVAQGPKQAQNTLRSLWGSGLLDLTPAVLRRVAASPAFINTVKSATDAAGLEFRTLPRSPLGAYLPGSSVKGALRTAWMFQRILKRGQDIGYHDRWTWGKKPPKDEWPLVQPPKSINTRVAQEFEALVLGYATDRGPNLHRDPFRQVRVGDGEPCKNLLLNRIGVFHPEGKMDGTVLLAETFRSKTRLAALVRLHTGLARQTHNDTVSHAISAQALIKACQEYYQEVAAREKEFAEKHALAQGLKIYQELESRLNSDPQAFPLRIGFGSGRMSIRLALLLDGEEGQEPKTRKTAGHSNPKDGFPMGWAIARLEPY
ncbi:type III-A CRISPR-associated RAMP protein Csm5 [Meiothermus ruber]|jgi:CRISPR-associated protein Csm5|uniref:CRISPR system Cms protein Csm5 n=1 Tax=Meiothermus ruber (strain ATCC 35948 / DSM 1279 / VKM B-1258 / 21) TaxID=504728 RepID=D3PLA3_MEIRD|nr:type III-A CRISPR-associated RAMP protein Csm5 [Meiothermus ruber]ADD26999.1 CRISPR-associated RAMP protein, Csm5 family [Meiothermus ruber DSM 1279]AGK03453.1 Csm5 family CRISPR-associated RAMP protein [Meiothermus ruber DSM 1279]MCL6530837.1 type III-A CRISPR-associated RAMP protein Csm5 [Meiothermus ruber]MCX7802996.1 type III-A CRISPR-associated RAMP protein Csm5 [Meiothermus ruber]GAO73916.1 Csm5 family CRISPR-associated RAMP protein [Meiothermus ruber H328]